ncbi:hypothetical protein JDFR1000234_56 [uncultured archaeal virus]|jgi:hypothetical protein|uniref:Uncharacterized protein n=1 Tax=uncultured archaeal virus TaxID=1960247 RepID=A0A1S5Y341_9VIRU|nr:hypothetical protein JDFR1000234_56 [uncultured archaeal virus]
MPATGAVAAKAWAIETTFKTEPASVSNAFGRGTRITSISLKNSLSPLYEINAVEAQDLIPMAFEGAFGIETILTDGALFEPLLGSKSGAGTDLDPYVYTVATSMKSITIKTGFTSSSAVGDTLLGCVLTSARIAIRLNEYAMLTLSGLYASKSISTSVPTNATTTAAPYTFIDATFEFPTGTTVGKVQTLELTIATNANFIRELNNREPVDVFRKETTYDGRFTVIAENKDFIAYALGGTTTATTPQDTITAQTAKLTFTDGTRNLVFELSGVKFDTLDYAILPNDIIMFDIAFKATSITVKEWSA